jgi:hypothetical protein
VDFWVRDKQIYIRKKVFQKPMAKKSSADEMNKQGRTGMDALAWFDTRN